MVNLAAFMAYASDRGGGALPTLGIRRSSALPASPDGGATRLVADLVFGKLPHGRP